MTAQPPTSTITEQAPIAREKELKKLFFSSQTFKEKYFPMDKQFKYQSNFNLFDRNDDKLLDYEELKEFLVSVGQMLGQQDLSDFYECLMQRDEREDGTVETGITIDSVYIIVLKKLREEDVEEQLSQAFKIVDQKSEGFVQSDIMKELLMTMGYKWNQELTDQFLKEFEPKGEKKVYGTDVVKKLIKR